MLKCEPMLLKGSKIVPIILLAFFVCIIALYFFIGKNNIGNVDNNIISSIKSRIESPTPTPTAKKLPAAFIIPGKLQVFQSFNNCGPASLSMMLSYFGINESQATLGEKIRPYQNPQGDNDDKSVTLEELAEASKEYNLIPYHRPNGDMNKLKQFVSNGIPVLVRTWLHPNEDIGHYRIVRGYDEQTQEIIQDDSYEGKNLRYDINVFNSMWEPYNYEYVILATPEQKILVEQIIGEGVDKKIAWKKAAVNSENILKNDPANINTIFNLSVAYYNIGEYQKSIEAFEKVENKLPFRTLWYQIEPIEAYFELGNYDRVFEITDKVLNNQNRAFSELYMIRGNIYKKQGNLAAAKSEYEKAVFYNINLKSAQVAQREIVTNTNN